ncbi:DUF389 domain-containing protein [Aphanothece sacrum]|uniref:Membrane protein n=1 Tax=Aphanothece sacrum FPU1 TaxID=1920663 RepID=A0A401IM62_APHSA|nr:DUF389 domain-containing protein [Aphanothece sacrum]GBF82325.1 membrane protein [Aphanothece sacrum FPU1]GBF84225.1 membrane protein [Aphanothece sacrum FPU3]
MQNWINSTIPKVPPETRQKLQKELSEESTLDTNFLVLNISACLIATLGLLTNSAAVIIGAMIVAPLMLPLRGLALGVLDTDKRLVKSSLITLAIGTVVAIIISGLVGRLFNLPAGSFGPEILARTQPNLADLGVAMAAGTISGFAKIRPKLSDAVAGTAIAVALMPPLCVVGISWSQGAWGYGNGAFLLYMTNFLGITLSCLIVFVLGGYSLESRQTSKALVGFLLMTGMLTLPLFFSFGNLIQQKQLSARIKQILQNETITLGKQAELVGFEVQWPSFPWSRQPPIVLLTVRENTDSPITPTQVSLVEDLLKREFNRKFTLIFRASLVREIRSDSPNP